MIDRLPRVEMVIVSAGGFFPYDWSGQPSESDWTTYQDRKDVHRTVFRALLLSAINDSALKKYISPSWEIYHINLSIIVLSVDINTKVIATEWSGVLWELTNVSLSDVIRIRYLYMSIKTNWQEWKIVLTNIENWWPRMSPKHWSNIEIQGFWKRISVLDPTDVTRLDWHSGQVFLCTNPMANADQLCFHSADISKWKSSNVLHFQVVLVLLYDWKGFGLDKQLVSNYFGEPDDRDCTMGWLEFIKILRSFFLFLSWLLDQVLSKVFECKHLVEFPQHFMDDLNNRSATLMERLSQTLRKYAHHKINTRERKRQKMRTILQVMKFDDSGLLGVLAPITVESQLLCWSYIFAQWIIIPLEN